MSKDLREQVRQAAFLGTLHSFGALTDDPRLLAQAAQERATTAVEMAEKDDPQRVNLRLAAELAALALDSAVEVAAGWTISSDKGRKEALTKVAHEVDKGLSKRVNDVRDILHGACYHGDAFRADKRSAVLGAVGRAQELVETILLARGRVKR